MDKNVAELFVKLAAYRLSTKAKDNNSLHLEGWIAKRPDSEELFVVLRDTRRELKALELEEKITKRNELKSEFMKKCTGKLEEELEEICENGKIDDTWDRAENIGSGERREPKEVPKATLAPPEGGEKKYNAPATTVDKKSNMWGALKKYWRPIIAVIAAGTMVGQQWMILDLTENFEELTESDLGGMAKMLSKIHDLKGRGDQLEWELTQFKKTQFQANYEVDYSIRDLESEVEELQKEVGKDRLGRSRIDYLGSRIDHLEMALVPRNY